MTELNIVNIIIQTTKKYLARASALTKPNELGLVFRKDGFSICFLNYCLGLKFVSKAGL